jgi:glutathione S-transferase
VLTQAGAPFDCETVSLESFTGTTLAERRALGSINGLFPVLRVNGDAIHESLAIAEYVAESFPDARLWPTDGVERARARAIVAEMVSDFAALRAEMSCHLFGRVRGFTPSDASRANIDRVLEIWSECLARSGGPFLFGGVSIADFFYYPVLTRFRSYGVALRDGIDRYAGALEALPAVTALVDKARTEPAIPLYDDYLRILGGDPDPAPDEAG